MPKVISVGDFVYYIQRVNGKKCYCIVEKIKEDETEIWGYWNPNKELALKKIGEDLGYGNHTGFMPFKKVELVKVTNWRDRIQKH